MTMKEGFSQFLLVSSQLNLACTHTHTLYLIYTVTMTVGAILVQ